MALSLASPRPFTLMHEQTTVEEIPEKTRHTNVVRMRPVEIAAVLSGGPAKRTI